MYTTCIFLICDPNIHTNQTKERQATKREYTKENSHKNMEKAVEGVTLHMAFESMAKGKKYKVYLEFADTPSNIGEEIRETLKQKYLQEKIGSMQRESVALQFLSQKEETKEEKGI